MRPIFLVQGWCAEWTDGEGERDWIFYDFFNVQGVLLVLGHYCSEQFCFRGFFVTILFLCTGSVFKWLFLVNSCSYSPDHSKTEPFQSRSLKYLNFKQVLNLNVQYASPHFSLNRCAIISSYNGLPTISKIIMQRAFKQQGNKIIMFGIIFFKLEFLQNY